MISHKEGFVPLAGSKSFFVVLGPFFTPPLLICRAIEQGGYVVNAA